VEHNIPQNLTEYYSWMNLTSAFCIGANHLKIEGCQLVGQKHTLLVMQVNEG